MQHGSSGFLPVERTVVDGSDFRVGSRPTECLIDIAVTSTSVHTFAAAVFTLRFDEDGFAFDHFYTIVGHSAGISFNVDNDLFQIDYFYLD